MKQNGCKVSILLFAIITGLVGCTSIQPAEFKHQSKILEGGRYTFAVYNDQHRLVSDPLSELYKEAVEIKVRDKPKPISDLYVISHGWNFTIQEAFANYHNYMEVLDLRIEELQKQDPEFNPYFIYVVWPSVARPLQDIAHAVLPFGLDRAIAPFTAFVDSPILTLPTGWKESLNAFSVALGTRYPMDYQEGLKDLGAQGPVIKGRDEDQDSDDRWLSPPYCGPVEWRKTERRANATEPLRLVFDYYRVDSEGLMGRECPLSTLVYHVLRWRFSSNRNARIHLVGHSYGAKLVTLAGMEAIRLQRTIGQTEGSESRGIMGDHLPPEQSIASLVLFNPALHPRELHYLARRPEINPFNFYSAIPDEVELLQDIPRKAVLYSGRDYPTGRLFDVSQLVFSNEAAQLGQIFTDNTDYIDSPEGFFGNFPDVAKIPIRAVGRIYSGSLTLVGSVFSGVYSWSKTKIVNIVPDWISHSRQDNFYDFDWSKGADWVVVRRTFFNAIDYWIPLGRVITNADADKMGILRTAIPALGSIGMDRLVARRWFTPNESAIQELIGVRTDRRPGHSPNHDFCQVAGSLRPFQEEFDPRHFYSYDATLVMDTVWNPAGSHGDVRSTDPPGEGHCNARDESDPKQPRLKKRQYMFNFTYNFTRIKSPNSETIVPK